MATASDQLTAFLQARPGTHWCAVCLAEATGFNRARVANVSMALEGRPGFRREGGTCSVCGRARLVLRFGGPSSA